MNLTAAEADQGLRHNITEDLSVGDGDRGSRGKNVAIESEVPEVHARGRADDVGHESRVDTVEEGLEATSVDRLRATKKDDDLLNRSSVFHIERERRGGVEVVDIDSEGERSAATGKRDGAAGDSSRDASSCAERRGSRLQLAPGHIEVDARYTRHASLHELAVGEAGQGNDAGRALRHERSTLHATRDLH